MGSLFRSEDMSLIQLFIQYEAAHATVNELGELGAVQFRDLNFGVNAFQRHFVNDIKRCDEMERKLRFLTTHIERAGLKLDDSDIVRTRSRTLQEVEDLETKLKELEEEITQLNKNEETLNKNHLELVELNHVLEECEKFFAEGGSSIAQENLEEKEKDLEEFGMKPEQTDPSAIKVNFVTGVIERKKNVSFEKILWRSLRGNLYMKQAEVGEELNDPVSGQPMKLNIFIIFCQGEQTKTLIKKVCESFGATLYPCPETSAMRKELSKQVSERIQDLSNVLSKTSEHRRRVLTGVAEHLNEWVTCVQKEKAVYHTMNTFSRDFNSKCFVAEGWCPTNDIPRIRQALNEATEQTQTLVPSVLNVLRTKSAPPTYHKTNKFTQGFQVIIDSYGVATYKEVNPAPFAIITFPFLFAVMFGDFGHGILMTIVALYAIIKEKSLEKAKDLGEIVETMFAGRYIILLMGLFSTYTGLIYNDMFSKSLPIFKTGWEFEPGTINNTYIGVFQGNVYPFGLDYAWHGSDNYLIFVNSYKMKMSVIFGVIQMTFGIILSLCNHVYFGRTVSIINEFIPQMLFLESIFGYLTATIIMKWCTNWDHSNPPSLLTMLINMFLSPGHIDDGEHLFPGQGKLQLALLIIALVSIPWMLLVKPFWIRHKMKHDSYHTIHAEEQSHDHDDDDDDEMDPDMMQHRNGQALGHDGEGTEEEEHDFGEIMVHQVIHTIEFCLGAISNTASYLRLWALSLAHAQLSQVLWDMTLGQILSQPSLGILSIGMWGGFAAWFVLTFSILLVMEGLSAFLHALRLHWVEFNGKFYVATGYLFHPFTFKHLGKDDDF